MGGGPSKEQIEAEERQKQLNKTKAENAAEIENFESTHADEIARLESEEAEKQERLDQLRDKNDAFMRERQDKLFEQQNSYMNQLESINEKQNEERSKIVNGTASEIRQMEEEFEQQKSNLEKKHLAEKEKIDKEIEEQKKVNKKEIASIEKEQDNLRLLRMEEMEQFEEKEMGRLAIHEEKMKEAASSVLAIKMEQIDKLRELQQKENEEKKKILQNTIETMVIYRENENNKRLANNFSQYIVSTVQATNAILDRAAVHMDNLDEEESRELLKELVSEWKTSSNNIVKNIQDLRGDLNNFSSANQNLRLSINEIIGDVEGEYRGVQALPTRLDIALKKNNLPQLQDIKTKFENHRNVVQRMGSVMNKVIAAPDQTLQKLQSAYKEPDNNAIHHE